MSIEFSISQPFISWIKAKSPVTRSRGFLILEIPNARDKVPSMPEAPLKLKQFLVQVPFSENVSQSLIGLLAESIIGFSAGQSFGTRFASIYSVI